MQKDPGRRLGFPSMMESDRDAPRLKMESVQEDIQHTIKFIDQVEKEVKIVEFNLERNPGDAKALMHSCAQLELKLVELQGCLEEFMAKVSHLR